MRCPIWSCPGTPEGMDRAVGTGAAGDHNPREQLSYFDWLCAQNTHGPRNIRMFLCTSDGGGDQLAVRKILKQQTKWAPWDIVIDRSC
eukprot:8793906-Alexandrium_andersonii.AAC.1